MPLSEAEKWLDHLGSCSPCYADFKRFQETYERQQRQRWLAAAAGILLVLGVAGWALLHKRNENLITQTAVLDLRDRSPARGTEMSPERPVLDVSRRALNLKILLPLGSSEGFYEVRVVALSGEPVAETTGTAKLTSGIKTLQVEMRLNSLRSGRYILQIRKANLEWDSYPIVCK